MALFGGKGFPTSVLVVLGAFWVYEVISLHAPNIAGGYRGDFYEVAHGAELRRSNPSWWLTFHAVTGAVVYIMWLLQASQEVRQWSYTFHRWNGRMSLFFFLPAGIFIPLRAFGMNQKEKDMELITQIIIALFGVAVLTWIVVGWVAIAKWKDVALHRQCMLRVLLGSSMFIIIARAPLWLYVEYVPNGYWFDVAIWVNAVLAFIFIEGGGYLMEKSFEKQWEYRFMGFFKVWDAPEEEKAVEMAPTEEQS